MFVNLMSVLGMARKLFVTQFAISFMIIPFRTPTPHNSTTNLHKRSRRQTQPLSNDRRRRPAVSLPVSDISCAHASEMVYDIPITAPVPHRPPPAPPHVDRMQCSDRIMDGNCPDRTNRTPGRTDAHYRPVAGPAERAPRAKWTVMAQRISLFAHCNHNARTHATNANTYVTVAACARRARPKVLPAPPVPSAIYWFRTGRARLLGRSSPLWLPLPQTARCKAGDPSCVLAGIIYYCTVSHAFVEADARIHTHERETIVCVCVWLSVFTWPWRHITNANAAAPESAPARCECTLRQWSTADNAPTNSHTHTLTQRCQVIAYFV